MSHYSPRPFLADDFGAGDYETAGLTVGLKLVVRPIDWPYEE